MDVSRNQVKTPFEILPPLLHCKCSTIIDTLFFLSKANSPCSMDFYAQIGPENVRISIICICSTRLEGNQMFPTNVLLSAMLDTKPYLLNYLRWRETN